MRKMDNPDVRRTENMDFDGGVELSKFHVPESETSATKQVKRHTAVLAISSKCYTRAVISAFHKKKLSAIFPLVDDSKLGYSRNITGTICDFGIGLYLWYDICM